VAPFLCCFGEGSFVGVGGQAGFAWRSKKSCRCLIWVFRLKRRTVFQSPSLRQERGAHVLTKIAKLSLLSALFLQFPLAAETPASMFPPDAIKLNDNYRDWYGPELEKMAEKPLWEDRGATHEKEIVRFSFIPGATLAKGRGSTVIRIEIEDGSARLMARAQFHNLGRRSLRMLVDKSLSRAQVTKLRALADQADAWAFRVGEWVKQDPEAIYVHCTELIMERRLRSEYAVSHALVSCEQPKRLMPLVNYVAELAGQRREDLRYSWAAE
jgi:hypothetical protein